MAADAVLTLGYDGSCGRCRRIATRAEASTGARLQIIDLRSDQGRRLRVAAAVADAPLRPTLFIERDGQLTARSGTRLAVALLLRLGPRRAWRILKAIGNDRAARNVPLGADAATRSAISRSAFLKGTVGGLVAVGALAGPAQRAGAITFGPGPAARSTARLSASATISAARRVLDTPDARVLLPPSTVERLLASDTTTHCDGPHCLPAFRTGPGRLGIVNGVFEGGPVPAVAGRREYDDGSSSVLVAFGFSDGRLLLVTEHDVARDGAHRTAELLRLVDGKALERVGESRNGAALRPVDVESNFGGDPCGGCQPCAPGSEDCGRSLGRGCVRYDLGRWRQQGGCDDCDACDDGLADWRCLLCIAASCGWDRASACTDEREDCMACASAV